MEILFTADTYTRSCTELVSCFMWSLGTLNEHQMLRLIPCDRYGTVLPDPTSFPSAGRPRSLSSAAMLPLSVQYGHSFTCYSGLEVNEYAEAFSHKCIIKITKVAWTYFDGLLHVRSTQTIVYEIHSSRFGPYDFIRRFQQTTISNLTLWFIHSYSQTLIGLSSILPFKRQRTIRSCPKQINPFVTLISYIL